MTYLQFKTTPFDHQLKELEYSKDLEYRAIFWEMGLGKTKHALDLAAYLFNAGKIKQILFVTKNGVDQQTVLEEIPAHLPLLENQYLADYWRDSERKWPLFRKYEKFTDGKLVFLAINCEALATKIGGGLCDKFSRRAPTLLVVDESQEFAGNSSSRTKKLVSFASNFAFRRIMTGTPSGGTPLHLYPQMSILSPSIFPKSFESFEWTYCKKQKGDPVWIKSKKKVYDPVKGWHHPAIRKAFFETVGYKNLDQLHAHVDRFSSRKTKAECLDLPEKIYRTEYFELAKEERELYNIIKNQVLAEIEPGKYVDTTMAITKLIRLQQVACGFVSFEDLVTGEKAKSLLSACSRLKALERWAETVHNKAIIWATFTTSIDQIMELLSKKFGSDAVVRYDGTVSDTQKQINKIAFKTEGSVKFLVGHPKAGGVGLNLPEASDVCYYSNGFNLLLRLQSEDRAHRIGSVRNVTYTDLLGINTIDDKIIKALKSKFDIASQLTGDQLREWIKS